MKNKYGEESQDYKAFKYNTELFGLLAGESPNTTYVDFILENGSFTKPYFSSELKAEYPSYEPVQYIEQD